MKIERLISIVMLLLERKSVKAAQLARSFEVSTRTIFRDIESLSRAGIPIVTYPGPTGGVGIMESYRVDKRLFTATDLTSLLVGLGGIDTALSDESMKSTLVKIKGMIPQAQYEQIERQASQIAIDLSSWRPDTRQEAYLATIKGAIDRRHLLTFAYADAQGNVSQRMVEPYRLRYKGNSWYLQGHCLMRNELRTFRFYRMDRLEETSECFVPRPIDFAALDQNIVAAAPLIEVTVRFAESSKSRIVGLWGDGIIESFEKGFYTGKLMVIDNERGYGEILLLGAHVECLAPRRVREYIAQTATGIAAIYGQS